MFSTETFMIESHSMEQRASLKDLFTRIRVPNSAKLASFGFGIILLTWLLAQLDFSQAAAIIREVPPGLLVGGFACYGLAFYARALRFKRLLPPDSSKQHLFPIVLVHYAALNIIPARLGELSYIYLLKKVNNVSTGCSVSNLILARVFDHITISVLFLVSSLFLPLSSSGLRSIQWGVGLFLVATCILLILLLTYKDMCVSWIRKGLQKFHIEHYSILRKILRELDEIVRSLATIRVYRQTVRVACLSLVIWLSIFGHNYCVLHAFQVELSYAGVIWASTCVILLGVLPLHMFGGFGIHKASWVLIALELGIPKAVAITSAFGSHLVSMIFLVFLGGCGLLRLQYAISRVSTPKVQTGSKQTSERTELTL
jgi:uncharacterized protein (TIRG00374 family)